MLRLQPFSTFQGLGCCDFFVVMTSVQAHIYFDTAAATSETQDGMRRASQAFSIPLEPFLPCRCCLHCGATTKESRPEYPPRTHVVKSIPCLEDIEAHREGPDGFFLLTAAAKAGKQGLTLLRRSVRPRRLQCLCCRLKGACFYPASAAQSVLVRQRRLPFVLNRVVVLARRAQVVACCQEGPDGFFILENLRDEPPLKRARPIVKSARETIIFLMKLGWRQKNR